MQIIPKKSFGQNFLNDNFIIQEIINLINLKKDDFVVEIGPGLGALTNPLITILDKLDVIEIDYDLVKYLESKFAAKNVNIYLEDALKFDFSFNNNIIRVVGNLPYNISTPLLFHLAKFNNIKDLHFMLQKEVVNRICASPNNSEYGKLSIMLQYKYFTSKLLEVKRTAFNPVPKVDSAIVRLIPRPTEKWKNIDEKKLNLIVTHAFNKRRKKIINSLGNLFSKDILIENKLDINKRAENLTIEEYIKLSFLI